MMQTSEKLFLLRNKMDEYGLDACIIPSGDAHLSEYPAEFWKIREWISGFTGSAGTLVVTKNEAGLWTDSRYYLQAGEQLDSSNIVLFKDGEEGVPEYPQWLSQVLMAGNKVGVNGAYISVAQLRKINRVLRSENINIDAASTVAEDIWEVRPLIPEGAVFIHDSKWTGATRDEKLKMVRAQMLKKGITHYITSSLDEIAWVLNLRGSDVPFNPIFHAYLIIEETQAKLFINPHKLTSQIAQALTADDINVHFYDHIYRHIKDLPVDGTYLIDPNRTNAAIYASLSPKSQKVEMTSIITKLKAIKNETEILNFKQTLIHDGVAMVEFLYWLENSLDKETVTEKSAAAKLKSFRAKQPGFSGESFETISAYNAHGAIVHYSVNDKSNQELKLNGMYLLDSGGQYPGGTTDITRTIALGKVDAQAITDYTLVLKGHIAMACANFPSGTRGVHIDILARKALWEHGLNYGHGTGHGIGFYLNVHEGPQSIRPQDNGIEIEAGMISSNEPGMYREGKYGIRIENLILCKEKEITPFGTFLEFETLTLCPIDKSLIDISLLTESEKLWLNNYHKMVFDKLSPLLDNSLRGWLKDKTADL